MVRGPVHCRCRVASGPAAIQPAGALLLSRFCGRSAGTEPKVELAAMVSCAGLAEPILSSSALRAGPGTATAVADSEKRCADAVVKVRLSDGSGRNPGQPERGGGVAVEAERRGRAARSCAGRRKRVTRTPGIVTSLMPAPGPPCVPPRVASMVIRSHLVPPDGTFSGCAAAVTCVSVTARPVAVVTTSRVATGRGMSSSRRTVTGPDRFSG